jgi:hypothetical protein
VLAEPLLWIILDGGNSLPGPLFQTNNSPVEIEAPKFMMLSVSNYPPIYLLFQSSLEISGNLEVTEVLSEMIPSQLVPTPESPLLVGICPCILLMPVLMPGSHPIMS